MFLIGQKYPVNSKRVWVAVHVQVLQEEDYDLCLHPAKQFQTEIFNLTKEWMIDR